MRIVLTLATLPWLIACSVAPPANDTYQQAINAPLRSAEAVARDNYRRPLQVLQFSGIQPGDDVVEIAPGGGYYTAILSRVVGPGGSVTAVDPERLFEVFPRGREGFAGYIADDPRPNVRYSIQKLDEINIARQVNQVWMVLYYHDTLWTGEDRAQMNVALFEALAPGGKYLVVDHHAKVGTGADVARSLHRMDRELAVREILAAGFVLERESQVLRHAADPHTDSVFDPGRRGQTDRFMLLFAKPDQ